jgi:hypothetical protein
MNTWIWLGIGVIWLGGMALLARRKDERWQDWGAGGLLALFVVAFFWRTIVGDVFQPADGGDLVSFLYPTYRFAAHTLAAGTLPLWNPTLYGGAPFISDIQAGFLYPPNLILFLINPDFPYAWMQWLAIGHLWWAGLGIYVLVRVLGFSRPAALLAGTAFALSDPLLIHLGNLNLIAVLAWMGWTLAAYHIALSRRSLRWAGVAAFFFAVANYAGHAQSSYYIGLAVGIYTVLWMVAVGDWRLENWRLEIKRLGDWGIRRSQGGVQSLNRLIAQSLLCFFVVAALTFLLSAPILLPSAELVPFTARADFDYQETVGFSLALVPGIVGLLTPGFFGRGPALHWSFWDRVELPYAGVPTLLLAVMALLIPGDRRRLLPWIGLAFVGFVVALGIYSPVHGWLTQILPGFSQFRAPARAIVLFTLGLSILAAAGMDVLFQRRDAEVQRRRGSEGAREGGREGERDRSPIPDPQSPIPDPQSPIPSPQSPVPNPQSPIPSFLRWGGLTLLLFVTPLIYAALLFFQEDSTAFLRASLAGLAVALATLSWLGIWLLVTLFSRGQLSARPFAALLIALLLVELSAAGSYTDIAESDPSVGFHHAEIVEFLRGQTAVISYQLSVISDGADPAFRYQSPVPSPQSPITKWALRAIPSPQSPVPSPQFRIDTRTGIDDLWQPDTAAIYGLEDVGGIVNPLALRHWEALWNALGGRHTRLYDMLNVRYVIVREDVPLPEKFVLAFDAPGPLAVYENPDAFPRAWLVEDAIFTDDVLAALQSPEFDPAQTVILGTGDRGLGTGDGAKRPLRDRGLGTGDRGSGIEEVQSLIPQSLNLLISSPNEMTASVISPFSAYLVLSEVWYPGWRATVNGEDAPVLRANHALRAVAVPAGESTVRLWFAPSSWRWGLLLWGTTVVALMGMVVVSIGRRATRDQE